MASTPDQPAIGPRLASARRRAGLSREALAVRAGLSWAAIAQIESGRRPNPRAETVAALARALGVTADYLLAHDAQSTPLLEHRALTYAGLDDLVACAAPVVAHGVQAQEPTLLVTTPRNADGVRERLGADAAGVTFADAGDWYSSPRAALVRYRDFATEALERGAPWLHVVGEPPWKDRSREQIAAWGRYEALLNLEFAAMPVTLTCLYDTEGLPDEVVEHAHSAHRVVLTRGAREPSAGFRDPAESCLGD
jgi:transcriptional regulator with XRE-family HTH domain